MIKKTKNFIKAHYIISGIILLAVIFLIYKIAGGGQVKRETYTVDRGDIAQKVIVSGNTKPVKEASLGFETGGKVAGVYADVGTRVTTGQVLVSLDQSEIYANLLSAKAVLASDQAKLDDLKAGTRPEEITLAETSVSNAQVAVSDAEKNLKSRAVEAYTKSDDAIHNTIDQFFSNPRTSNPQLTLTLSDTQLKNDINQSRAQMEYLLSSWKKDIDSGAGTNNADSNLSQVKDFIDKMASAVNSQTSNSSLSQTTVDSYKSAISVARTNIVTAMNNLTSAETNLNSANSALTVSEQTLFLKKRGNTPATISAQEAKVMQDEAQVQNVEAQMSKTSLRSPLSGVVTKQDAKTGEIVTVGKTVTSVISDSDLEIESNVSEINIGKVTVGNEVNMTFDAFPGQTFSGSVTYVDPAETIIDGVVNYKITVAFSQKYPQMRSGLTSQLEILTNIKKDVIRIPEYSVIREGETTAVLKKTGNGKDDFVKTNVTLGVIGQDGYVEVTSGLSLGDIIDSKPVTTQ